jgi:hypothetical protein
MYKFLSHDKTMLCKRSFFQQNYPIASLYTAVLDTTLESLLVYVYIRLYLACLVNISAHERI